MSELFNYVVLEKYMIRPDKDHEFAPIMQKWFYQLKAPHVYRDTHSPMVF